MIVHAAELADGADLVTDVAVVGAGPGGIVTALELARHGLDVVLLESGRTRPDAATQRLGDAADLDPARHAPMSLATSRRIGGASTMWGGRCVPYDPVDFDERPHVQEARWPVAYEDFRADFARACEWCACGRPVFDARESGALSARPLVPSFPEGEVRSTSLERWSLPTDFGREYRRRLQTEPRLRLIAGLTCTGLRASSGQPGEVSAITARRLDGATITLRAARYVLACGGLETTRLLLASPGADGRPIGDHSGHLGRWYMAHLEGFVSHVRFRTPAAETRFDYERDEDGTYVRRRLTFDRDYLHRERLPNIAFWLGNPQLADAGHRSGVLSLVYLMLSSPAGRLLAPDPQRRSLIGEAVPGAPYGGSQAGPWTAHAGNVLRDLGPTAAFAARFAWRRFAPRRRAPGFFVGQPDNRYPLQYHAEHLPHPESRVSLASESDALGLPRLRIDIRFDDADVEGVVRAHHLLGDYLERTAIGSLELDGPDPAAAVLRQAGGGFHQIGTTRMAERAADGVVDPELRVHGWPGLSIVSSSVFPSSGQANSTFMIVVCAVRVARRLAVELASARRAGGESAGARPAGVRGRR